VAHTSLVQNLLDEKPKIHELELSILCNRGWSFQTVIRWFFDWY